MVSRYITKPFTKDKKIAFTLIASSFSFAQDFGLREAIKYSRLEKTMDYRPWTTD